MRAPPDVDSHDGSRPFLRVRNVVADNPDLHFVVRDELFGRQLSNRDVDVASQQRQQKEAQM